MPMKYLVVVFSILFFCMNKLAFCADGIRENKRYICYPNAYKPWKPTFCTGVSVTRLPTEIVESEVNTSPVITLAYRQGMPWKLSSEIKFISNYVSNLGSFSLYRTIIDQRFSLSIGGIVSVWFGHLDFPEIKLKSFGVIYAPTISAGYDFHKFLVTLTGEMNYGFMDTSSDDKLLGTFNQPRSLYSLKISVEQPLWNNHSVVLSLKNNYAKFYYQSWLSYSTIKEYLYYPEFSVGFIF